MYALGKVIGAIATPLIIALIIAAAAALCRAIGRRPMAIKLTIVSAVVAYLSTIGPIGSALLAPLERMHPPLSSDPPPHVNYVVVLGSGYTPRNGIPVTAAIDYDGIVRIVEGIRLMYQLQATKLVVSGGAPQRIASPAVGYAKLARELGIPGESLILLDLPRNTASEAAEIVALLRDRPFVLVTSAYHMPRAVRLVEAFGGRPIPAPTGQRANESTHWSWRAVLPSSSGLRKTEQALHEYLGLMAMEVGAY